MANLLQAMGNAQPVSQFIDTALKYQTVQSNMETHRMQQQLLQQQVLQSEKDNKLYDPNAVLSLYDEHTRPHIMEAWKQSGVLDPGTGQIRGADVRNTPQLIVQNQKVSEALMTAEYERLAKKNATLAKKTDAASQQEALDNVAQMTAIEKARRLGKDKQNTVVPAGASVVNQEGDIVATAPKDVKVKKSFVDPTDGGTVTQLEDGTFEKNGQPFKGDLKSLQEVGAQKIPVSEFGTFYDARKKEGMDEAQISTAWEKMMNERQAAGRMAFQYTRGKDMIDTKDGSVQVMNWAEINQANKEYPGRFKPATPYGAANAAPGAAGLSTTEQLANFKGKTDPVNIRSIQLINALDGPTNKLREMAHQLPFETGIQAINNILREGSVQVGGIPVNNWETFVIEYTKEVNRAMTGVGSVSEKLITQQQDVLKKSKTIGQALGALDQIEYALHARRQAVMEPIYKGKKTDIKSGPLTLDEAKTYLKLSGGDKEKARQMAVEDGRTF